MITAVLNKDGVAIMGVDGFLIHFGGPYRIYRKPHSIGVRAAWAARWSTPEIMIVAKEDGFEVTTNGSTLTLGYHLWGMEMLMCMLDKTPTYRKRTFKNPTWRVVSSKCRVC